MKWTKYGTIKKDEFNDLTKNVYYDFVFNTPSSFTTNKIIAEHFAVENFDYNQILNHKSNTDVIYGIFEYKPDNNEILCDTRFFTDSLYKKIRDDYHEREVILLPGKYKLKCIDTNNRINL